MARGDRVDSEEARRAAALRALEAARHEEPSPGRDAPDTPATPRRQGSRRGWLVALVVVGLVVLVGAGLVLAGSGDDEPDEVTTDGAVDSIITESSGPTVTAGTDTSVAPTTGATLPPPVGSPPPPLDLTGDDLSSVALQILAFRSWLLANPDPALTSEIFVPGSPGFETFRAELTELSDAARVVLFEGFRPTVTSVLVFGAAQVDVALAFDARIVYDAETGESLRSEPGATLPVRLSLERGPDQRWRATQLDVAG